MLILCHFRALWGGGGAWLRLAPLDMPLKGLAPRLRLTRICVLYIQNLKTISAQIIFKKCMQNLPCIGKLYHRFKQTFLSLDILLDCDFDYWFVATALGHSYSAPLSLTPTYQVVRR